MTSPAQYSERLTEKLAPLISDSSFYLESVLVRSAGRRLLVQVIVDADGHLDLDEVARLSRQIDALIEEAGLLDDAAFTLEVSSPGIDRPLTLPRHWRNNVGRKVRVILSDESSFEDRIASAMDTAVTFENHGSIGIENINHGQVQIEFNRANSTGVADDENDLSMHDESSL